MHRTPGGISLGATANAGMEEVGGWGVCGGEGTGNPNSPVTTVTAPAGGAM